MHVAPPRRRAGEEISDRPNLFDRSFVHGVEVALDLARGRLVEFFPANSYAAWVLIVRQGRSLFFDFGSQTGFDFFLAELSFFGRF